MLTIHVQDQGTQAMFARLAALGRSPRELTLPAARDVANLLRRHYTENQALPHKHPGAKKNFWREVSKTVQAPVEANGGHSAVISITHPAIRQKVTGGTITAKRARALTIPVSAEAYEAGYASTFERETGMELFWVGAGGGSGALATRNEDGSINLHYLLRKSVKQAPDPRALPALTEMIRVALDRMRVRLARLVARAKGGV
jgi:hypothetical protein